MECLINSSLHKDFLNVTFDLAPCQLAWQERKICN